MDLGCLRERPKVVVIIVESEVVYALFQKGIEVLGREWV